MKSSEISTRESTLELPKEIKDELDKIKNILCNNSEFFNKLTKECMRVGKKEERIYYDHIEKILTEEYFNITAYNDGYELMSTTYDFTKRLCAIEDRALIEALIEDVYLIGD